MAYLKRYLTLLSTALVAGPLGASPALAQNEPAAPPSFRTFGVGSASATSNLFFENKGKAVPLIVDSHGLSPGYPIPASGVVSLFRETAPPSPDEPPGRGTVAEVRFDKTGPALLALVSTPTGLASRRVTAVVMDDSTESHPMESARVFNFSRRKVALQTPKGPVELATGASHVVAYPEKSRVIDLKIAIREKGEWLLCSTSPQGIIPKTRMIIVIADDDPTPDNPSPVDPVLNTIYDTAPPPVMPAKLASAR